MRRIRWDTYVGMGFSNLIAFFIILSTAATLHVAGIIDIQTSAQAAEALRPLGGQTAFLLFSLGIIGTGMLAVPVLAGSAAYAVSESFDWQSGMDMKLHEALEFYGIIAIATVGRRCVEFHASGPDAGAGMERRDQRRHRRAHHGGHDAAGLARRHHGQIRDPAAVAPPRMGRHRGDGGDRRGDVRHDVSVRR